MPPFYEVAIALLEQPPLSSKWAIVVAFTPSSENCILYEISGFSENYTLEAPQSVTLTRGENGYWGKVLVGRVDHDRLHHFSATIASVPIVRGDSSWSCQNWVMDSLAALQADGHYIVNHATHSWISDLLAQP
ncbi:hypothetical protein BV22DRAFT_1021157 [Leucogyrophana mollusca]|uniref:Uncharacterized protein n=1 Tax=Leucogyrophana mollusca TaxID=85980 RepID=A0ACB8B4V9_9AGAM|nr:hypothetical protein BV22DRAFT_1021157 [Leucogyrophana mollusca]